jgi:hypothetical protein
MKAFWTGLNTLIERNGERNLDLVVSNAQEIEMSIQIQLLPKKNVFTLAI